MELVRVKILGIEYAYDSKNGWEGDDTSVLSMLRNYANPEAFVVRVKDHYSGLGSNWYLVSAVESLFQVVDVVFVFTPPPPEESEEVVY